MNIRMTIEDLRDGTSYGFLTDLDTASADWHAQLEETLNTLLKKPV